MTVGSTPLIDDGAALCEVVGAGCERLGSVRTLQPKSGSSPPGTCTNEWYRVRSTRAGAFPLRFSTDKLGTSLADALRSPPFVPSILPFQERIGTSRVRGERCCDLHSSGDSMASLCFAEARYVRLKHGVPLHRFTRSRKRRLKSVFFQAAKLFVHQGSGKRVEIECFVERREQSDVQSRPHFLGAAGECTLADVSICSE